jgi:hypothetical protein
MFPFHAIRTLSSVAHLAMRYTRGCLLLEADSHFTGLVVSGKIECYLV